MNITEEDLPDSILQEFIVWYYENKKSTLGYRVDELFLKRKDIQNLWLEFFEQSNNIEIIKFWNKKCG